ncbi:MAG: hypothetical protein CHACPFDD_02708 [Phycisphaerae bacterium]|nr:hypothetical protein [Phycisphaerae bacterium]
MPTLLERFAARAARLHAAGVYRRFRRSLRHIRHEQSATLRRLLAWLAGGELGRQRRFARLRSIADFRAASPIATYEDVRPLIERVMDGDTTALFSPGQRVEMFALSSGTTAAPKYVPVTPEFVRDYRRGWNTFGLKLLSDHPRAILRHILQISGRHDEQSAPCGLPCGAITGLMARTQKRIVRRFYVGDPAIAAIDDARARYYALMRFGVQRDVSWAVTANPATLIQMARVVDEESETLIRDVRDGTLAPHGAAGPALSSALAARLRPDPSRAQQLEQIRSIHGHLHPRDYWRIEVLACWTGGSMGLYLPLLRRFFGDVPVRDIGLLASEGRVTIPLDDDVPFGPLDPRAAFFEFIPLSAAEQENPATLLADELSVGESYVVVLTNFSGLIRYRLDDVVAVRGSLDGTPLLEFLHRAGRVASIAGEKLTENQVIAAALSVAQTRAVPEFEFLLGPHWADPPCYRLALECAVPDPTIAAAFDAALQEQNAEYSSRRRSLRLAPLEVVIVPRGTVAAIDAAALAARGGRQDQFKRQTLLTQPGELDHLVASAAQPAPRSRAP